MRILTVIAFLFLFACKEKNNVKTIQPPKARKETKVFNEQGKERKDDYYWLSNPQDTSVIAHLKAENAYVEALMKHTEGLQKKLYDEMVERIEQRYESLPTKQNGYWYYATS